MSTDTPSTDSTETTDSSAWQPATDGSSVATAAPSVQQRAAAIAHERPEAAVGAAFAGGLLFALILKRLAR